jgi:hypothetical protein
MVNDIGKGMKKNLIYFIWWNTDNGMLEYNLNLIEKYLHIFDGQILIINVDYNEYDLNHLGIFYNYQNILNNHNIHYLDGKNDPINGEKDYFKYALSLLPKDDSITFYAHAKGVSRVVNDPLKWWVKLLYEGNLETLPDLETNLFSGCFGKLRPSRQCPLGWHYSGSFFWFKTKEVLQRYETTEIPKEIDNRWFTENFPSLIAKQEECEFRLWSGNERKMNFYAHDWWNRHPEIKRLAL